MPVKVCLYRAVLQQAWVFPYFCFSLRWYTHVSEAPYKFTGSSTPQALKKQLATPALYQKSSVLELEASTRGSDLTPKPSHFIRGAQTLAPYQKISSLEPIRALEAGWPGC